MFTEKTFERVLGLPSGSVVFLVIRNLNLLVIIVWRLGIRGMKQKEWTRFPLALSIKLHQKIFSLIESFIYCPLNEDSDNILGSCRGNHWRQNFIKKKKKKKKITVPKVYDFLQTKYNPIVLRNSHMILINKSRLMKKKKKQKKKNNKITLRPSKTQISLGIRPVWSESSLCA